MARILAGEAASNARVLSPALAMERQLLPGPGCRASTRMSASSQHWAYRMPEKSARSAASLRMSLTCRDPTHRPGGAVEFDYIAIVKPFGDARDCDDCWYPKLTRHDCRVGKQAPSFHEQSTGGGKQHDPSGIGVFGNEDAPRRKSRIFRVAHDADTSGDQAWAATDSLSYVPLQFDLGFRFGNEALCVTDGTTRFETLGRRRRH